MLSILTSNITFFTLCTCMETKFRAQQLQIHVVPREFLLQSVLFPILYLGSTVWLNLKQQKTITVMTVPCFLVSLTKSEQIFIKLLQTEKFHGLIESLFLFSFLHWCLEEASKTQKVINTQLQHLILLSGPDWENYFFLYFFLNSSAVER